MDDLELEILNIINKTIEGQYIGKLKVIHDDDFYQLFLYLNQEQSPMVLAKQGTEEEFKTFVCNEIKHRRLESVNYWKMSVATKPAEDQL